MEDFDGKIYEFLAKVENPKKNKRNPFFNSNYADLEATKAVVKNAASPLGLQVFVRLSPNEEHPELTKFSCIITDQKNERCLSSYYVKLPEDPQKAGSAETFHRRYILQAGCDIIGEDDDDGNASASNLATPDQLAEAKNLLSQSALSQEEQSNRLKAFEGSSKESMDKNLLKMRKAVQAAQSARKVEVLTEDIPF